MGKYAKAVIATEIVVKKERRFFNHDRDTTILKHHVSGDAKREYKKSLKKWNITKKSCKKVWKQMFSYLFYTLYIY